MKTPETAAILDRLPALTYNAGTAEDPCFGPAAPGGRAEILPDPYNKCDTPETIDGIMRYNAARDAARKAAGLPKD